MKRYVSCETELLSCLFMLTEFWSNPNQWGQSEYFSNQLWELMIYWGFTVSSTMFTSSARLDPARLCFVSSALWCPACGQNRDLASSGPSCGRPLDDNPPNMECVPLVAAPSGSASRRGADGGLGSSIGDALHQALKLLSTSLPPLSSPAND